MDIRVYQGFSIFLVQNRNIYKLKVIYDNYMVIKLDLKDKKLLYELDLNSRQSYNQLSKKLKLSKTSTLYRIKQLQKKGIIKQFQTTIDTGKLGYIGFRLYFSLQRATPNKKREIIDFLNSKEFVVWLVSIEGDYDIGALILVKSVKEMSLFWKEFLDKYLNYVDKRLLTIMSKVSYFSRAYLLNLKNNIYEINFITEPEEIEIDDKDRRIMELMATNSRRPIIEIASKVKLTTKTVIERIKQLENKKVIVGHKTVFDLNKLGYQYFKLHFRLSNTTNEKEKKFRSYIKSHPNIVYEDVVLGGDDLEIEIQVQNLNELRKILDKINEEFADIIKEHKIMQFYEEHKYLILPLK